MSTAVISARSGAHRGHVSLRFVTAFLAVCVLLLSMATWAAATEPVTPDATTTSETAEVAPAPEVTARVEEPAAPAVPAEPAPATEAAPAPAPEAPTADQPAAPAQAPVAKAAEAPLARVQALAAAARDPKAVDVVDENGIVVRNISRPPTAPWQQWDTVEITIPLTSADVAPADMPLQPGDFFTLNFPSTLTIFTGTVALLNQNGVQVARCVIQGGAGGPAPDGTPDVKCTFNDEISQFSSFTGTMRIGAQLNAADEGGPWSISVNGDAGFDVTVPGGGVVIGTPDETPTAISKDGWFEFAAEDPTVMLWMLQIPKGTAANGEITITDTLNSALGDHYILQGGTNTPQLRVRSNIPNPVGGRNDRYGPGEAGCPWTFTPEPGDQPKSFTAVISDACFDPNFYYTLYYRTKVTNPATLVDGAQFGNTANIAGTIVNDDTGFYQYADGSLNGPGYGGVAARKAPLAGPAAGDVPATATYSVKATWTQAGEAREQTMILTAGGEQKAINEIPQGTQVTLSELTLVSTNGVVWGDPVFSASNPNVVVSGDKKSAVITVGNRTVVGVLVTNTAFGTPKIDIEKWSTNETGPTYDAAGNVTNDGYAGDHDGANGKVLDPLAAEQITFTVSNNGKDALKDIVVSDATTDGPQLTDISCTFPTNPAGTTATTWAGPFAVGTQFTCTGTLPALGPDAIHADRATVVGVGVHTGTTVTDSDEWSGETPVITPSIDIEKYSGTWDGVTFGADGTPVLDDDGQPTPQPSGDHDSDALQATAGTAVPVTFTITNTGDEALKDVSVTDVTWMGPKLANVTCTFPDGSTGLTWAGPLAVKATFTCTGTLPGMLGGAVHSNTAVVDGTGVITGENVGDEDDWNAEVPPAPGIDIEKYNTAEGHPAGDRDTAGDAKEIPAGTVDPVTMTITNTGNQPLLNVTVTDKTLAGVDLTDLSCTFPNGSKGTTWVGPFMPGATFDCTGTIPAQPAGAVHANKATVVGTPAIEVDGEWVPQPNTPDVTDNDDYHDKTPPAPVVPPTTPPVTPPVTTSRTPLAFTGTTLGTLLPVGALALLVGAALVLVGRRRTAEE